MHSHIFAEYVTTNTNDLGKCRLTAVVIPCDLAVLSVYVAKDLTLKYKLKHACAQQF
jgi:hypothetical protein